MEETELSDRRRLLQERRILNWCSIDHWAIDSVARDAEP